MNKILQDRNRFGRLLRAQEQMKKYGYQNIQLKALSNFVFFASQNVPLYQSMSDTQSFYEKQNTLEIINRIPLKEKDELKQNVEYNITNYCKGKVIQNASGGSTGQTAFFYQDEEYRSWNRAVKRLVNSWIGMEGRKRTATLWGARRDIEKKRTNAIKQLFRYLYQPSITLDTSYLSAPRMESIRKQLVKFQPELVRGYAENLYEMACFINESKKEAPCPTYVISEAGTLTESMRSEIQKAFGTKVINRYGCREMGIIASENGDGKGLYVSALTHYVEILDEHGHPCPPGVEGEIVVTCLINKCMPLIRYRVGDTGIWAEEDTEKTLPYPLLKTVTGRVTDLFKLKDGSRVRIMAANYAEEPLIHQCQFIQHSLEQVEVKMVLNKTDKNGKEEAIRDLKIRMEKKLHDILGKDQKIIFNIVDDIPKPTSGKFQYAISKVLE